MIPIFDSPGLIAPGQFGPTSVVLAVSRTAATLSMSATGMPSVMAMTRSICASIASSSASIAAAAGTKTIDAFAPVSSTALATVSNIGISSIVVPPAPGLVPPTTFVPYSFILPAWKRPSRPMPWTMTRVSRSSSTLTRAPAPSRGERLRPPLRPSSRATRAARLQAASVRPRPPCRRAARRAARWAGASR